LQDESWIILLEEARQGSSAAGAKRNLSPPSSSLGLPGTHNFNTTTLSLRHHLK